MSHPFGDLVTRYRSRKHGLSQNKLAEGIDQDPAVISAMCNGRRLSGRQARERVLAIIRWFMDREVLATRAEADALLEAAGMARLRPDRPAEAALLNTLFQDRSPSRSDSIEHIADRPEVARQRPVPWMAILVTVAALGAIGLFVGFVLPLLRRAPDRAPLWQEDFDPLHPERWQSEYASAEWEDIPGPGAVLREDHPLQDYGKAESVPIAADVDNHPILRVSVTAVDPGASYTVQVLDKINNTSKDVLEELVYSGEHTVDLGQAMSWQGLQVFTINLWVGGESRSVTFDRISIEADRSAVR
jgi:hypothetical protein